MNDQKTGQPELSSDDVAALEKLSSAYKSVGSELSKIIVGQQDVIEQLMIAIFARGHCLLEGVPGLAKTLMVSTLARTLNLDFARIQFTPDLMPSDIVGTEVIQEDKTTGKREFKFLKGPVFSNVILADEINRTPPKTQSALLEAMQEHRITVAGKTYQLEEPFFVLATQNPIEQEGTYPLPEAQLDRFMFCLNIGYPSREEEVDILLRTTVDTNDTLNRVLGGEDILAIQRAVRQVPVPRSVAEYTVRLVQASRPDGNTAPEAVMRYVRWGAGPRASQYLALAGKVLAVLAGRYNVAYEDIQASVKLVLRHRILTNYRAEADQLDVEDIIDQLITHVAV
ncbi:MAG: AAA family ATPase [Cyanobacteria bacterium P01_E01_bin.48]